MQRLPSQLNSLGPFFAIEEYAGSTPDGVGWQPLAGLITDPAALLARIETVRARLSSPRDRLVERRPAASAVLLGLVARLLSPALASAVLEGRLLELQPAQLY
ncbi:MAG TPA: hypothetical protein VH298_12290, partial [Jatrophihabitans sp.]|nr:hypothetical protein [Jatrophihabitans sp.]